MTRIAFALLIVTSSLAAATSWAQAVSVDATSLMKRLDAIEGRLSAAEARRSASTSSGSPNIGGAYTTNDIQQRLDALEDDSNQLRGGNDRATQAIEALAKRFDDYAKDMDMRMSDLEARVEKLSTTAAATPAAVAPVAATTEEAAAVPTPAATTTTTPTTPKPTAAIPADLSASEHYNKAYAYLTATDYKNAQIWFEEFLKRHPKDPLADNAYYWLGEVYLVQNNPNAAVTKFRDGLKSFPKGSKVTANLFKMGVALEQLKQPKLAQAAWEKLVKDYPTAPEAARAKDKLVGLKQAATKAQ